MLCAGWVELDEVRLVIGFFDVDCVSRVGNSNENRASGNRMREQDEVSAAHALVGRSPLGAIVSRQQAAQDGGTDASLPSLSPGFGCGFTPGLDPGSRIRGSGPRLSDVHGVGGLFGPRPRPLTMGVRERGRGPNRKWSWWWTGGGFGRSDGSREEETEQEKRGQKRRRRRALVGGREAGQWGRGAEAWA